jgi:hypothetical protein
MPLVSSPESVRRRRVSALAIFETIAASGISLWLAWKHNSIEHIVIASALAPFLLLRTRLSTWYTIRVYDIMRRKLIKDTLWNTIFAYYLIPIIKALCLIKVVLKYPSDTISNIPNNFYKNVFVIDFLTSPQVISGADEIKTSSGWIAELNVYTLSMDLFQEFCAQFKYLGWQYVLTMSWLSLILLAYVPFILLAFSYRLAMKSTAFLWLPLLWIIHQSQPGTNVLDRIELSTTQPWAKVVLTYSIIVILGFMLKLELLSAAWKFENLSWLGPLGGLATQLVAPLELPLWQIASALNGGLAWAYFFQGRRHLLARNKTTEAWPEAWVEREYVAFQALRTTLSLYAIACTLYIAALTAWQAEWPPIHFILLPRIASSEPPPGT